MFRRVYLNFTRKYSSDADLLNKFKKQSAQYTRVSPYEPRAPELIEAVRCKNYSKVKSLVNNGVNINGHDKGENTALTDAAARGDTEGVKKLVEYGAGLYNSCGCPQHRYALLYAVMNNHYETTKLLLELGTNPNVMDSSGNTAKDYINKYYDGILVSESKKKNKEKFKLLLEKYGAKCHNELAETNKEFIYLPKA